MHTHPEEAPEGAEGEGQGQERVRVLPGGLTEGGRQAPGWQGGGAQIDDCHCTKRLDSCRRDAGDRR